MPQQLESQQFECLFYTVVVRRCRCDLGVRLPETQLHHLRWFYSFHFGCFSSKFYICTSTFEIGKCLVSSEFMRFIGWRNIGCFVCCQLQCEDTASDCFTPCVTHYSVKTQPVTASHHVSLITV